MTTNTDKKFYIIRHGEADYGGLNPDDFFPDIEKSLTENGISQSKLTGLKLATSNAVIDAIYSSPKERAIQTGEIVLQQLSEHGLISANTDFLEA